MTKDCAVCGKSFTFVRGNAKYCPKGKCRSQAYRDRKKEKRIDAYVRTGKSDQMPRRTRFVKFDLTVLENMIGGYEVHGATERVSALTTLAKSQGWDIKAYQVERSIHKHLGLDGVVGGS